MGNLFRNKRLSVLLLSYEWRMFSREFGEDSLCAD